MKVGGSPSVSSVNTEPTDVEPAAAQSKVEAPESSFAKPAKIPVKLAPEVDPAPVTDAPIIKVAVCMGPTETVRADDAVGVRDAKRTDGYAFTAYDGKGWSRTAVDPNNPYKGAEGPVGERTGAKFVQVPPNDGHTLTTTGKFVTGEGLSDLQPVGARSTNLLPDGVGGRVLDQNNFGTEKEVYDALRAAKTPEAYANLLNSFGGTFSGKTFKAGNTEHVSNNQHIFSPTEVDPKVSLRVNYALGPYEQVASYMAANPEVATAAKEFSAKTGINAHVYAEWQFLHEGGGRDQGTSWPKEVTYLPRANQVFGFDGHGDDPYSAARAQTYLKNNPDVAELAKKYPHMSAEQFAVYHYSQVGLLEGRSMGAMNYQGRQGTAEFERFYAGGMSKSEAAAYWNPEAGAQQSESAGGQVRSSSRLEQLARTLGVSALTAQRLSKLTPQQQEALLQLLAEAPDGADRKAKLTEALNAMLRGQQANPGF